jgi:anti-sigma B factor antagonist
VDGDTVRDPQGPQGTVFAAEARLEGDDVLVRMEGELDLSTVHRFRAVADDHDAARRFVLDVAAVTFIDSTGLGALVDLATRTRRAGGAVVLAHPDQRILRLLELTSLDQVFDVEP